MACQASATQSRGPPRSEGPPGQRVSQTRGPPRPARPEGPPGQRVSQTRGPPRPEGQPGQRAHQARGSARPEGHLGQRASQAKWLARPSGQPARPARPQPGQRACQPPLGPILQDFVLYRGQQLWWMDVPRPSGWPVPPIPEGHPSLASTLWGPTWTLGPSSEYRKEFP